MNEYAVLKLVTGDQILATIIHDRDEYVVVSYPVLLRAVPFMRDGAMYEKLTTAEFCSMTDDKEFNFNRKDILFIKPMKKSVAVIYLKTLEDLYIRPSSHEESVHDLDDSDEIVETTNISNEDRSKFH